MTSFNNESNRDQEWLENLLADIWYRYFFDVEQSNRVKIKFGRNAIRRLGSISIDRKDKKTTIITVTGIYKNLKVPDFVVKATIVHEMSHYSHGFNSPINQRHKYPHSGGVIRREFAERGLEKLYLRQQKWLKANWPAIVEEYLLSNSQKNHKITYVRNKRYSLKPWWIKDM